MGSGADVRGLTPRRPTKYLHHAVHDFLNKLYLCIMKKTHPERAVLMGSGVSMSLQRYHFPFNHQNIPIVFYLLWRIQTDSYNHYFYST